MSHKGNETEAASYTDTVTCGTKSVRTGTKRAKVYLALRKAGSQGLSVPELQEVAGSKRQDIFYLIHALRKDYGIKIKTKEGRYIYKGEPAARGMKKQISNKSSEDSSVPEEIGGAVIACQNVKSSLDQVISELGNVQVLRKVKYLHDSELSDYLTMLKKALYYKSCAAKLIETNELFHNARQEVLTDEV